MKMAAGFAGVGSAGRERRARAREKRKRATGRCATAFCRNRSRKRGRKCNTCYARTWDAAHPLNRLFRNLKAHAKARRKSFTLTFEDFEAVAIASGYHEHHGATADGLTVDRIDPARGYEVDNIQFLTNSANAKKAWWDRHGNPGAAMHAGSQPF